MVEGKKGFVKFHLAITREMHAANIMNGVYPKLDRDILPDLSIRAEDAPNFKDLQDLIAKVGKPYGWDRRKEYHDKKSVQNLEEKLAQPASRRFSFWAGSKEVGGTVIANIEPNIGGVFEKAISNGEPLIDLDPSWSENTIEIYKIGLMPEYTGNRWGGHFVSQVLTRLFNEDQKLKVVYLNTRNTNHNGVISFYTGLNMNVIHARSYPDDLIPEAKRPRRREENGGFGAPRVLASG